MKTIFIDVADQAFIQVLWMRSIFELKIEFYSALPFAGGVQ